MSEHMSTTQQDSKSTNAEIKPQKPAERSLLTWAFGALPTVLVIVALAGTALWGHHTDWKMPSFADLTGNGAVDKDDWCEEHAVPESICVACNKGCLPSGCSTAGKYGWCDVHGVHDCPFEHPDVAQTVSSPTVTKLDLERAKEALALKDRPKNNSKCKKHLRVIQFANLAAVTKTGVETDDGTAFLSRMMESVFASGEIVYDQNKSAHLSTRAAGAVWQVDKQVGDRVSKGELLALIDAGEVGRVKAEFLQAFAQLDVRSRILEQQRSARGSIPERTIQETEATVREARVRVLSAQQALVNMGLPINVKTLPTGLGEEQLVELLRFLGLPKHLTKELDPQMTTANLLPVRSPLDGIVVERHAVSGEVVSPSDVLFVVADTRTMWLNLNVHFEDAGYVQLGQRVLFMPDGSRMKVEGKVVWISTAADEKTRTIRVRAELPNSEGKLRGQTFGAARIILRDVAETIVVPNEAVHWEGDCNVVFVRDKHFLEEGSPKIFHVRTVRTGAKDDKNTEIIAGVLPGEIVATKGSGILRSELLKNNLGAG